MRRSPLPEVVRVPPALHEHQIGDLSVAVTPAQGMIFVHRNEAGIRIDTGIPTGVPVSEIRLIKYSGPRAITNVLVTNLESWLRERIDEGFSFETAS
jgi:hypothetical protein